MKNIPFLIVLTAAGVLGWVALGAPEPTWVVLEPGTASAAPLEVPSRLTEARADGAQEGLVVRTVAVQGMCCNGCRGKLYTALLDLPGVDEAAVDFEAGTASVRATPEVVETQLVSALTFDKYSASALN